MKTILHVKYLKKARGWIIEKKQGPKMFGLNLEFTGFRRPTFSKKTIAVSKARKLAKQHSPSKIVVHKMDGSKDFEKEYEVSRR